MKKYFVLLLILSTQIFAQIKPEISSIKTLHILEGTIDNKYFITMYLTIVLDVKENTKTVSGKYYYNNIGDFLYFGESVLDQNSKLALKEFSYSEDKSTGQFTGTLNKKMVFKGTWSNGKKNFNFEVKPNKNSIIQEIEIKEYTSMEHFNSNPEYPSFEVDYDILQISNPKKLTSIEKINKALEKPSETADDFNDGYSNWKESAEECLYCGTYSWSFSSSYEYLYSDNNIISRELGNWYYTGGAHQYGGFFPIIYSLDSGEVLNKKVDDLVYSVDDEKLLALLRQKLSNSKRGVSPPSDDEGNYFNFESIRLNDRYKVTASGITFLYNQYEIAPYSDGIINIHFTFDEFKPFVKKDSELYYLFE